MDQKSTITLEQEKFQDLLDRVLDTLRGILTEKNRQYGNAALEPLRIFSQASPVEQLNVRLDDKISRLQRGQGDQEDSELDLLGYLVLKRMAMLDKSSREEAVSVEQAARDLCLEEAEARILQNIMSGAEQLEPYSVTETGRIRKKPHRAFTENDMREMMRAHLEERNKSRQQTIAKCNAKRLEDLKAESTAELLASNPHRRAEAVAYHYTKLATAALQLDTLVKLQRQTGGSPELNGSISTLTKAFAAHHQQDFGTALFRDKEQSGPQTAHTARDLVAFEKMRAEEHDRLMREQSGRDRERVRAPQGMPAGTVSRPLQAPTE